MHPPAWLSPQLLEVLANLNGLTASPTVAFSFPTPPLKLVTCPHLTLAWALAVSPH